MPLIHHALAQKELLPSEHLLDAGYVDAGLLVDSKQEHHALLVGPVIKDHSWQAREAADFDVACFGFDWEADVATYPRGAKSRKWSQTHDQHSNPIINIRFNPNDCKVCADRAKCTHSATGPRNMTVRPQAQHIALQEARTYQKTANFKARYTRRAGIEGTISQGVNARGLRRTRYRGLAKTRLQHVLTAAAINLQRMGGWLAEMPRAHTRVAPFVALARAGT